MFNRFVGLLLRKPIRKPKRRKLHKWERFANYEEPLWKELTKELFKDVSFQSGKSFVEKFTEKGE